MRRRLCALTVASAALAATIGFTVAAPAAQADPPPVRGAVISVEPMTLNAELAAVGTGKRIRYWTTNPDGTFVRSSAAVLRPTNGPALGGKIIAHGHGSDGLGDSCAPSVQPAGNLDPDPNYLFYSRQVREYLAQGWTVTATDYPGLGTAGLPPFLVGASEGRAVIDSVRAVRNLYPALSTQWVSAGHSQGGQAALFAAQMSPTYGQGLNLKGVVGLAPATELQDLAANLLPSPYKGYIGMGVLGLSVLDPTVHPAAIFAAPAKTPEAQGVLRTGCLNDVIGYFYESPPEDLIEGGALPPSFLAKLTLQNPGRHAVPTSIPVLLVHGGNDPLIPTSAVDKLEDNYCHFDDTVTRIEDASADHDTVLDTSRPQVVSWIADRFAGASAVNDC